MSRGKYNFHDFYCLKCGQKTYSLPRPCGHQRPRGHYKKLYCPFCKVEINNIEITSEDELWDFRINFEEGGYIEDAEISEMYCKEEKVMY
jgi:hypothetical protein